MATRTRTQGARNTGSTVYSSAQVTGTFRNPKVSSNFSAGPYTGTALRNVCYDTRESIQDITGHYGGNNSVVHSRKALELSVPVGEFKYTNTSTPFGVCEYKYAGTLSYAYLTNLVEHLALPNGSSVALARIPGFGKELMSGLNSIYELKDLRDTLRSVPVRILWAAYRGKLAGGIAKNAQVWARETLHSWRQNPVSAFKSLVGLDLAWKFGWRPLLGDIQTVSSVLGSIDNKLDRLRRKPFSCVGRHIETKVESVTHYDASPADTFALERRKIVSVKETKATWVAGVLRQLSASAFDRPNSVRLAAIREMLGLSLETKDIWAAMPLSFVVDWFFPIITFLEQFSGKNALNEAWFVTVGTWQSSKMVTSVSVSETVAPYVGGSNSVQGQPCVAYSAGTIVDYTRSPGTTLPGGIPALYVPHLRLPNLGQWWTGAELALQRMIKTGAR